MALKQCVECDANISDKAITCPKCGSPEPFKQEEFGSCVECLAQILLTNISCPNCGHPHPFQAQNIPYEEKQQNIQNQDISREDYLNFIGKNADTYFIKFNNFIVKGGDKFSFTWHWPAFFGGCLWMLYRKLYWWALGVFLAGVFLIGVSSLTPVGLVLSIVLWFVWGVTGNYLYYKQVKKKIHQVSQCYPTHDQQRDRALARAGGVNIAAVVIGVLLIVIPPIIGFATIAIPNFSTATQRSKRKRTEADMRALATALGSFNVDENAYPVQISETAWNDNILPSTYWRGSTRDGWGNSYLYWSDGTTYRLTSYGKDKKIGGDEFDEDIVYSDGERLY